jgi:hypothetical protein
MPRFYAGNFRVRTPEDAVPPAMTAALDPVDSERDTVEDLRTIHRILAAHPGTVPVQLSIQTSGKRVHLTTAATVAAGDAVMEELRAWV